MIMPLSDPMSAPRSMPLAPAALLADPARLAALRETALLDSPSEDEFDRVARVAIAALAVPSAFVTLVAEDRQYLKSCVGVDGTLAISRETSLEYSFCQHVLARTTPLVIEDARQHPLVAANLGTVERGVVAYLGVPLTLADGNTLGSFCVVDTIPRAWTSAQIAIITDLAAGVVTEIELRSKRRQLEASELKFRSVAESARDAIVATDELGRMTFWNAGATDAFGWTREEMEGQPLTAIVPERMHAALEAGMATLRAGGPQRLVGRTVELTGQRRNGTEFPLEVTLQSWTSNGRTSYCGMLRDLTLARHALEVEQALERQHEFLATVLENISDGIVACDSEGTLTVFNRATREFHGLPETAIPRDQWAEHYDLFHGDGTTRLQPAEIPLVRALAGEVVAEVEMVIAPRGRPKRSVLTSGQSLRRSDGTLLGAVIVMHDVTDERRIAAERDRLVAILEGTPDFVSLMTPGGQVQYLNPAARRMLGLEHDAPTETLNARLLHPPQVYAMLEREALPLALRDGSWVGESAVLAEGGRPIAVWQTILPHRNAVGDVEFISTVMRDISVAKANEQALRAAREQADRANRAKSDFLSRASHELRTPLNSVIGFADILLKNRKGRLAQDELTFASRIARNGRHLLGLVNDLLDLSKIEAGKVEVELSPVSLFDLVHDVRESLASRAADFGLLLTVDIPDDHGAHHDYTIIADEQRLRQILLNLASNAVKYTPSGAVAIRLVTTGRSVPARLEVSDTGPGIAEEQLSTIFEPFTVGDAMAQGDSATGLGLAITQSLCTLLGYDLAVRSTVGEGTTFSVHLTRASAEPVIAAFR